VFEVRMILGACGRGDYNIDGTVNTLDVIGFLNDWSAGNANADHNCDGQVDTIDVISFLNDWNAGC
ncbi:MAG: GC-type dockerin domain-anchored protein, partial [Planctomycetota bacterium]|nr:GC-type dockerin domain-anchored protein [Planctomycetota bacterium]